MMARVASRILTAVGPSRVRVGCTGLGGFFAGRAAFFTVFFAAFFFGFMASLGEAFALLLLLLELPRLLELLLARLIVLGL